MNNDDQKKITNQKFQSYISIVAWIAFSAVILGLPVNKKKMPDFSRSFPHPVAFL